MFGVQAARKRAFEKPVLYPEGPAGDAIPLAARLMAIADVYDALISRRVYKPAFTHKAAMAIVEAGRGSHLDSDIVDAFVAIQMACKAIGEKHANTDEELGLAAPSLGAGNA